MEDGDVENYVNKATPGTLECRAGGRHAFPNRVRRALQHTLSFTGYNEHLRLFEIREDCESCQCAYRIVYYENVGTKKNPHFKRVGSSAPRYKKGPNGEIYTADPGLGRISPRQVDSILVTQAMSGKTLSQITREAREAALRQEEQ